MNYTKEQFEKLPKWAQSEITRLEANLKHFKEKAAQVSGESETNTHIVSGLDDTPLPKNSRVKFTNDKGSATIHLESDGTIDVHANSKYGHRLAIFPNVSNGISITFVKD